MPNYAEQLRVPVSWWVLGMISATIFASTAWAGFSVYVAIACYVVFCGGCAAALLALSHATIEVTSGELRVGASTLPLAVAGEVAALDEARTRVLRGPSADPRAFMMVRPWLSTAVYIEVTGEHQERPYWLIGTRRPAELAAAIERSRPQARADGTPVG